MGERETTFFMGRNDGGNLPDSPIDERPEGAVPFVVLSIAGETFAIEIDKVREIIRVPQITWVPGAQSYVRGVINLRGRVVAVLDLAAMLGIAAFPECEVENHTQLVQAADAALYEAKKSGKNKVVIGSVK